MIQRLAPPGASGLYDPQNEHDSCGIALVAKLWGEASHAVVEKALEALENLEHRGAEGADPNTGDGAGILVQIPDGFLRAAVAGVELPPPGRYGVGVCYLPADAERRVLLEQLIEETIEAEGQRAIWWRDVPVDERHVGDTARLSAPVIRQVLIEASEEIEDQDEFERKLYVIRRLIERSAGAGLALPSFSSRTMVYKGMLTAPQLPRYFIDLRDPRLASRLALVHSRFSTNTFPSWELAHPYRMIAHNGEVNTLRGNVNWMRARESQLASDLFGDDLEKVIPVVREGGSDSAIFDNVLELLVLGGRSIPHAVMMMVPEAYRTRSDLDPDVKGFYDFHSCLMEPWDGPAAVVFTDGRLAGAVLDRNGLRPGRWIQDTEGYVVLASETGVMTVAPEHIQRKGRLAPGKLFLVDLEEGRIVEDEQVKRRVSRRKPYAEWYEQVGRPHRRSPRPGAARAADRAAALEAARLRLLARGPQDDHRADGDEGRGAGGEHGQRRRTGGALRPPAAVVRVLQAAVRAGHQSADRPAAREGRDEPSGRCRRRGQPADRGPRTGAHARHGPADPAKPRAGETAAGLARRVRRSHAGHHVADRAGAGRDGAAPLRPVCRGRPPRRARRQHSDPVRPQSRSRAGGDAVAAGRRGRPPPPRPPRHPAAHRPRDRVGRAARHPPHGHADRLRRSGDQPVRDVRVARRARRSFAAAPGRRSRGGREADRDRDRQGAVEDDLEDGDLDDPVLLRCADLRGGGAGARADRRALHRNRVADRRRRPRCALDRGDGASLPGLPADRARSAAGRRRSPVAPRRRAARVEPRHDRQAPARRSRPERRPAPDLSGVRPADRRRGDPPRPAPRPDEAADAARAGPARAGRARDRDRQAVHDRGDEPRRAQPRGARDDRDRDEPDGRASRTPAKGARIPPATSPTRTAICGARRSSRSPRGASA